MEKDRFLYIAGPCVIEDEGMTFRIARELKTVTAALDVDFVFKASFDKANRTSVDSYRGPGLREGLRILRAVRDEVGVRVLSDVHEAGQVAEAADVLDIIQIPAFLCRQTDLLVEAGKTMKPVNIKKGQFVAPGDMLYAIRKVESTGNHRLLLTERGTCFGYNQLTVDFTAFSIMAQFGYPVVFDVTHAVQMPSKGGVSSGHREYVMRLARAAAAYGVDGVFTEVHPEPDRALCDGPNSLPLHDVETLLREVLAIRTALSERGRA